MTGTNTPPDLSLGHDGNGPRRLASRLSGCRKRDHEPLAGERDLAAQRTNDPDGNRGAEIPRVLAEHDRGGVRDDRLERHLRPRYDSRDIDAAMTRGGARQPSERAFERSNVDLNARALTRGAGDSSLHELERVDGDQDRLVASALDPGRDREEVEKLDELVTRRIDDSEIAGGRLAHILADQR